MEANEESVYNLKTNLRSRAMTLRPLRTACSLTNVISQILHPLI